MSTSTRRGQSLQGQTNNTGKKHGVVNNKAQQVAAPGRRAGEVDLPFPNKPVTIRPHNPRTLASHLTKEPRTKEHRSSGTRETAASQHPRRYFHRQSKLELHIDKEIHAKKLLLQEKLWRLEETVTQKIQKDSVKAAAGDNQMRREPVRGSSMMKQEKRHEDVKQLRERQEDQRDDDRMRNTHAGEMARWKKRETEVSHSPHSQRKGQRGTHEITVHGQDMSGEPIKSRWENVKERTRGNGGDGKDNGMWGETVVKAKERDKTRDQKYRDRTWKDMYGSDDEQDKLQMSQQKISHRTATENRRGAGRNQSGEPRLPPVSGPSHSDGPEQGELTLTESTDVGSQRLPCKICNRKFASERLEVHVKICKKHKQSHRQVFNSYNNRTKGSTLEEFLKFHSVSTTPEVGR